MAVLPLASCPSCGEEVRGRFCSNCGQSHADVRVPFWKWLRDYIDDTFHLDSNLARSMGMLVRRPGALTVAYLEGERSKYVRPFRLYLTASFLYFLALSFIPAQGILEVKTGKDASGGVKVEMGQAVVEVSLSPEDLAAMTAALGLGRIPLMQWAVVGYLFLALRRVHGQSRVRTALKTAVLYGGYGVLLLCTVLGTMMASLYFAG